MTRAACVSRPPALEVSAQTVAGVDSTKCSSMLPVPCCPQKSESFQHLKPSWLTTQVHFRLSNAKHAQRTGSACPSRRAVTTGGACWAKGPASVSRAALSAV